MGLKLSVAGGFPHVVILGQEIALRVELRQVILDVEEICFQGCLALRCIFGLEVQVRLRCLLLRNALRFLRARRRRVGHEGLVVLLARRLVVLRVREPVLEVLRQAVEEGEGAIRLARLRLVRSPCLWGRRRCFLVVNVHLNEGDAVHLREHNRRGGSFCNVLRWAVELVELVLRLLQKLHRSVVLLHELDVLAVLLLPLLSRFGNRQVQFLDLLLEEGDLIRSLSAALLAISSSVSFCSLSVFEMSLSQKDFCASSLACSSFKTACISVTIWITLEKSTFFALSAFSRNWT